MTSLQFLSGGGEMGALMRTHNWESSLIGTAENWPQSLRTTLSILLNSKFPMFLYWGSDLICFYNDAYRLSLGNDGKHPSLLGMKGEDAWPETWHIVKPQIDQVLTEGESTWSEDQFIPIYREGELKDAYWTFSFSPVKNESNQTAGVFLTLIETTEKVNNLKKLIETNDQLAFAIEATELGTFDLNPLTNKFIANNRLKDWFGLSQEMEVDLELAIGVIVENDRSRVTKAIQKTLQYESGGLYDIEYSILNSATKQERIVRAQGRAWFGVDNIAYRFNGTLQDITRQAITIKKIEESEQRFRNLILQAPVLISTFEGPSHRIGVINKRALEMWGKTYEQVINKPLFEVSPETEDGLKNIFNNIYATGEPFIANEIPVQLKRIGKPDTAFFNTVYQPLRDLDNKIYGIITIGTEITESVNAGKLIEASEKRFSNILSQSIMAIGILKGTDMVVTFANDALLTTWGKGQNVTGKPLLEVLPELKDQGFSQLLDQVYTTGIPYYGYETKVNLIRNGKEQAVYYNFVYQPYTEINNCITGITILATEVTEQVLAKQQIEESEEEQKTLASHLKLATDSAKVGIWSLDIASSKLEWSNIHKTMWGYDENCDDLTYEDWHKVILPEDKELAFQKIEESKVNYDVYEVEYRINKADDNFTRSIRSTGKYYYNEKGDAEKLTGISIDITEQKLAQEKITESEKQFRVFADSIQNLAWIANADGWIYFYNQQWYDYTGTTLKEMEGSGWQKVHDPDKVEQVKEFLKNAWKKDETFEITFRLRRHDGEYRWFLTRGYPVKDGYGNIERWIGTNTDIHEQKTKEQQKDEFISIASHEMKTPLTTAKGYLELLLMLLNEDNQSAFLYAKKASQSVERLHSLITELLDASKIQNGKLDYNVSMFDFNEMVEEAIENIQLTAKNHSLQKIGHSLPKIRGDKDRLQQVMINLLSNAVKYSPHGKKIFIKMEEQDSNILVSVQDFGVGMLSQHLDRVFDRYYRVQEHAVHFQGLGIGLYISSNIIQRHEGKLWVDSEPGKGSTFYFTLPL